MDTDTPCPCQRKTCHETWHRNPTSVLMEEVTLTIPRHALERAGYLVDLMDGSWSTNYKVLAPYLLNPKPDPSTPLEWWAPHADKNCNVFSAPHADCDCGAEC